MVNDKEVKEFNRYNNSFEYIDRGRIGPDVFFWKRDDRYGDLSNFSRHTIKMSGTAWPTVEHYFQAMKEEDERYQMNVLHCGSPKEAKLLGRHANLREDWEDIKESIMRQALIAKFTQNEKARGVLLKTGNCQIHEDSPWDMYWGYCNGKGKDRLGRLLMEVRDYLKDIA